MSITEERMVDVLQKDFDELLKIKDKHDWDFIAGGSALGEFDAERKFVERVTQRHIAITEDGKLELTNIFRGERK